MALTIVCRQYHHMPWGQLPMISKDIRVLNQNQCVYCITFFKFVITVSFETIRCYNEMQVTQESLSKVANMNWFALENERDLQ